MREINLTEPELQLGRDFTVKGDRVALKTPPTLRDGVLQVYELMWQRIEVTTTPFSYLLPIS